MKPDLMLVMGGEKPGETGAVGGGCMAVPLSALTVPDEQDAPSAPAVGDRVSYQVDGVVESVTGDQAQVRATAINGTPLPSVPASTEDADCAGLRERAVQQGAL